MSVIVAVRKGVQVVIASDTQTSSGDLKIPGDALISPSKLHKIGAGYLGIVGSTAHHHVIDSLYSSHPEAFSLESADSIFETFRSLQKQLVDDYYLRTEEDDSDQEYESNQMFGIAASRSGIFTFQSYREVTEYKEFCASGSGSELAIGSMASTYRKARSAKEVAIEAVRVACRYHKDCGEPVLCKVMRLRDT